MSRRPRATRIGVRTAAVVLVGVVATGCSLFGGSGGPEEGGPPPKVELGSDGKVEGAIASAQRPSGGHTVQADILSLKRYDDVLRLEFAIIPRSQGSSDALGEDAFGGDSSIGGDEGAADGAYLVDTQNLREYVHLTVGEGTCACSRGLEEYPLEQPTVLYSDFPAPEEDVDSLTVVLPIVGPIPDVEVS